MKVGKDQENFYISQIRKLIVVDDRMSVRELDEQLLNNGIRLDKNYIWKLRNKIHKARMMQTDRVTLNFALGKFADTMSETAKECWKIALDKSSSKRDKISALVEIRKCERDLFDKLFDAGVFQRKLGEVDLNVVRNRPISSDRIDEIINNMKLWGFDPTAKQITSNDQSQPAN